ncbi:MAG: molybdate ABC transporter substrate-binding protein [Proteobacteria bacterium]|nr:molybdate ABC transporter substrate-binding protein [Pseudomonadota bacterium]
MRYGFLLLSALLLSALPGIYATVHGGESLLVFAGAASKPPTEEAAKAFEKKTGVKVDLVFGGSGFILSQMMLAKRGDIYFPGSSDFMEIARKKGAVVAETEKKVVYLVQAINVQKGNPKGIRNLRDLARPGLRVAIANPEGVCVGLYAVETIEKEFSAAEKAALRRNLVNYTESCEKTATAVSLKTVDAVIGWSVFQHWDPARIETIPLKKSEIIRIGYIPVAVASFSNNKARARQFIDFLLSEEGSAIYRKYHYFMSPEEASAWIGAKKPVGGEYALPAEWRPK